MNKRELFKLGAGGVAAMALGANGPSGGGAYPTPGYPPSVQRETNRILNNIPHTPDPFHAIRAAAVKHATEQRELYNEQIERKYQSLGRMRSVSEAYRAYMITVYRREQQANYQRWETFVNGVWGAVL